MKLRLLMCLIAALMLSACIPSLTNLQGELSGRPTTAQLLQMDYTTPGEIEAVYDENTLDADKKYRGKWTRVRGVIAVSPTEQKDVWQTETTGYSLLLADEKKTHKTRFTSLHCGFPPGKDVENLLRTLKTGQVIEVGGRLSEYHDSFGGPFLEDCVILKK